MTSRSSANYGFPAVSRRCHHDQSQERGISSRSLDGRALQMLADFRRTYWYRRVFQCRVFVQVAGVSDRADRLASGRRFCAGWAGRIA